MKLRTLTCAAALLACGAAATAQNLSIGFADPVSSVDPQLNNHAGDRSLALHSWDSIIDSRRRQARSRRWRRAGARAG